MDRAGLPDRPVLPVATTNDDPYLVCGEQQDRASVCVSSTGGTDRFGVGGGESGPLAVDPRDSNVFYAGNYDWFLTRFDRSGRTGLGARVITAWPDNPMGHPAGDLLHRPQWTFPLVTNPAEPDAVYAVYAGSQFVMKSTNGGQSWQRISPDLTYFPIKLNDKIAALHGVIESVDARPTDQTGQVFDLLSGQFRTQLDTRTRIVTTDMPAFNQVVQSKGLPPISCTAGTPAT